MNTIPQTALMQSSAGVEQIQQTSKSTSLTFSASSPNEIRQLITSKKVEKIAATILLSVALIGLATFVVAACITNPLLLPIVQFVWPLLFPLSIGNGILGWRLLRKLSNEQPQERELRSINNQNSAADDQSIAVSQLSPSAGSSGGRNSS